MAWSLVSKAECGAQFTAQLEGMFSDMEKGEHTQRAFEQDTASQAKLAAIVGGTGTSRAAEAASSSASSAPSHQMRWMKAMPLRRLLLLLLLFLSCPTWSFESKF